MLLSPKSSEVHSFFRSIFFWLAIPSPWVRSTGCTFASFCGSPPNFFFNEIAGFKTSALPVVSPEIRCPSTPRRHRSIGLCTQENIWILCFQSYPSLCRAAMKRSLNKIAGFGGSYRRISIFCFLKTSFFASKGYTNNSIELPSIG